MKIFFLLPFFLLSFLFSSAQQKLLSPREFLGYELGERFSRHQSVVEYYKHIADVLPNADLIQYGETYEHRPLVYLVLTSMENFNNLERIRLDNLRRTGIEEGNASPDKKAIIWMSYNVHGNEANSLEASMWTLYELANPSNQKSQGWLKNTIVIMDPCINPDGRDRYANFYNQYGNFPPNPDKDAYEHHEPWPGGRANHYLFDLNRDWAWTTQIESQQRIRIYNEWLPHVHIDFHEQGYNNPYYFAPAAEPMHEVISPWQRDFQGMIGKNNAKYFDEQGWLYFTKEVFDLYYPGYGDTYPTFNGAIGMTYEQAGGGIGGLTITTETGEPLTLKDRITHHHTTGLSTVEITSNNAERVVGEFEKYFLENNTNPASYYKTYVIKGNNNPDKINQLTAWLSTHKIRYGHPNSAKTSRGFDFQTQTTTPCNVAAEDLIINIYQPKSRFITTLFEPASKLSDTLTYDITAWNLMYAYDLNAYALTERINIGKPYNPTTEEPSANSGKSYAFIFKYQSIQDVALLAALLKKNVKVRSAEKSFSMNGEVFNSGSLIVTRGNNSSINDFDKVVLSLAREFKRKVFSATTGFVEKGKDFGSRDLNHLKKPMIGVLFGEQTSSLSSGEIWHFFEKQLQYPITQIGTDYVKKTELENYDILIVPDGSYRIFDDEMVEQFAGWVRGGGRLILMGNALNSFVDKKGFGLHKFTSEEEKSEIEGREKEQKEKEGFIRFEERTRKELSASISGAVYKLNLDNSHPLGFGMRNTYFTLKTNELRFGLLTSGWNVSYFKEGTKPTQGFAGYKANRALGNSLLFGVEPAGRGEVVYLVDNPLFRGFWENGKMLFANAVFMSGQ